jgi:hypothetical protein
MMLASRSLPVVVAGVLQWMGCCAFAQTQEPPTPTGDSAPTDAQEPNKPSPWLLAHLQQ